MTPTESDNVEKSSGLLSPNINLRNNAMKRPGYFTEIDAHSSDYRVANKKEYKKPYSRKRLILQSEEKSKVADSNRLFKRSCDESSADSPQKVVSTAGLPNSGKPMTRTVGTLATYVDVGVATEADSLGPCDPGTYVNLSGIVWHETKTGVLVVNVTWRNRSYVGTLLDATKHDWAPPRISDVDSDADFCSRSGRPQRLRGKRNTSAYGRRKSRKSLMNNADEFEISKSTKRARMSVNAKQTTKKTTILNESTSDYGTSGSGSSSTCTSPVFIECPYANCKKIYRENDALEYHTSHSHQEENTGIEEAIITTHDVNSSTSELSRKKSTKVVENNMISVSSDSVKYRNSSISILPNISHYQEPMNHNQSQERTQKQYNDAKDIQPSDSSKRQSTTLAQSAHQQTSSAADDESDIAVNTLLQIQNSQNKSPQSLATYGASQSQHRDGICISNQKFLTGATALRSSMQEDVVADYEQDKQSLSDSLFEAYALAKNYSTTSSSYKKQKLSSAHLVPAQHENLKKICSPIDHNTVSLSHSLFSSHNSYPVTQNMSLKYPEIHQNSQSAKLHSPNNRRIFSPPLERLSNVVGFCNFGQNVQRATETPSELMYGGLEKFRQLQGYPEQASAASKYINDFKFQYATEF